MPSTEQWKPMNQWTQADAIVPSDRRFASTISSGEICIHLQKQPSFLQVDGQENPGAWVPTVQYRSRDFHSWVDWQTPMTLWMHYPSSKEALHRPPKEATEGHSNHQDFLAGIFYVSFPLKLSQSVRHRLFHTDILNWWITKLEAPGTISWAFHSSRCGQFANAPSLQTATWKAQVWTNFIFPQMMNGLTYLERTRELNLIIS